jgi:hypothetical protein
LLRGTFRKLFVTSMREVIYIHFSFWAISSNPRMRIVLG